MNKLCLRGGIRITDYGNPSIYLFPNPGESPRDFKHLDSPQLQRIIVDHFDFFQGDEVHGNVHGRSVSIDRTKKDGRKIMRFSVGFLDITMLEDKKANDGSKAILFIELPFHDPVSARVTSS